MKRYSVVAGSLRSGFKHLPATSPVNARNQLNLTETVGKGAVSSNSQRQATQSAAARSLKPYSAIPSPKGLPVIGTAWDFIKPNGFKVEKLFEVMKLRAEEYGPIYVENLMTFKIVVISDVEEYSKVVHVDGKYPRRMALTPMVHYNSKKKMTVDILNSQGEDWYKIRKILIRKMLPPAEIAKFVEPMDLVSADFVTRLNHLQSLSRDHTIYNLQEEAFKLALESIGCMIFEERIGCLMDPVPMVAQEFIRNVIGLFRSTQELQFGVPLYKVYRTKSWRTFENHYDTVIALGRQFVNKKLETLKMHLEQGVELDQEIQQSAFLTYLLSQKELTLQEVSANTILLLFAAVDTTSNALLWTLYCLAKHPEVQDAVRQEINRILPNRSPVTVESLQELRYVKACLKEALRLYPVAFTSSRIIAKDIECFGYQIPAGTHCLANLYAMGHNEKYFPEAESFKPQRWLRSEDADKRLTNISSLIFGHGARMCIGRRFAEQEIYVAITKILQNFRLENRSENVEPILRSVMTPDRPVNIAFVPIAS